MFFDFFDFFFVFVVPEIVHHAELFELTKGQSALASAVLGRLRIVLRYVLVSPRTFVIKLVEDHEVFMQQEQEPLAQQHQRVQQEHWVRLCRPWLALQIL